LGILGTGGQLLVLLLFVLPGSVFQTVRTRLRGPVPSDQDATTKVLRALAVSTLLNAVYVAVFGKDVLGPVRARSSTRSRTRSMFALSAYLRCCCCLWCLH
jgi:hypothetical protein